MQQNSACLNYTGTLGMPQIIEIGSSHEKGVQRNRLNQEGCVCVYKASSAQLEMLSKENVVSPWWLSRGDKQMVKTGKVKVYIKVN